MTKGVRGNVFPASREVISQAFVSVGQTVNCYYLQSDNKLLVGGMFSAWNGAFANNIVRLDLTGALDNSFTPTSFSADIYKLHQQPDGKILVGGRFTTVGGVSRNNIARLNSNGTNDFSFSPGAGFSKNGSTLSSDVDDILLQPDGKIILCGNFDSYNNYPIVSLARLDSNGAIDTTFKVGTGFNGGVAMTNLLWQPDGKIIAFGSFSDFNTTSCGNIARLEGSALAISVEENKPLLSAFNLFPNPTTQGITIGLSRLSGTTSSLTITNALGERVVTQMIGSANTFVDLSVLSKGVYFAVLQNQEERAVRRFVKE